MSAGQWSARARRRRLPGRAVVLVLLAVAVLAVVGWRGGHGQGRPDLAEPPPVRVSDDAPATAQPGPARREHGVPAVFARSEDGAVAAAASFVTTGQALMDMDPLAADKAVRQMAAGATAGAQVEQLLGGLDGLRRTLDPGSGPITYRQAALAWRLDAFTPDRARVAVWHVGVLARHGVAPPQAGWATSAFDLVWERGDWRVWAETVTPGPAPIPDDNSPPATSAELAAALDGFAAFEVAP